MEPVVSQELPPEAIEFGGPTIIGGLFESSNSGAAYISGYFAHKLAAFHSRELQNSLQTCSSCSSILTEQDLNIHLFLSFKEYNDSNNASWGLKYCSSSFISNVISYEKIFLYTFEHSRHLINFKDLVFSHIYNYASHPAFCNKSILDYFISFFIKCRIFQSIKFFNSSSRNLKIKSKATKEKLTKLTGK